MWRYEQPANNIVLQMRPPSSTPLPVRHVAMRTAQQVHSVKTCDYVHVSVCVFSHQTRVAHILDAIGLIHQQRTLRELGALHSERTRSVLSWRGVSATVRITRKISGHPVDGVMGIVCVEWVIQIE